MKSFRTLALALLACASLSAADRPNIVLMFLDDPLEQDNVIADHPEIANQLRQTASDHLKQFPPPAHSGKEAAFTQVNRGKAIGRSVRTKRWRYTEWGPDGRDGIELQDQENDPGEYHNLVGDPEHAAARRHLVQLLKQCFPDCNQEKKQ